MARASDERGRIDPARFTAQLRRLRHRLGVSLSAGAEPLPPGARAVLVEGLEALGVAEEELRIQNEALAAARDRVEDERRRYQLLFLQGPDGTLVTDLQGVIREANRAAAAMLGVAPRFLPGKPVAVFVAEPGRPAFRAELARLGQAGEGTADFEVDLRPRHGAPFRAAVRASTFRDTEGESTRLLWSLRDVTLIHQAAEHMRDANAELERHVAERTKELHAALAEAERLLMAAHEAIGHSEAARERVAGLVHGLDAVVWTADAATGRYRFVSHRAEELLGYPVAAWLDDPGFWAAHLHPEDREWAVGYRRRHVAEGRGWEAEFRMIAVDGRAVWFRENGRLVAPEGGGPAELRGVMVGIGRRKKVERQLYAAKQQLATELDDLAYLHELNGRLAAATEPEALLQEVLRSALGLLGATAGAVLLHDPSRREFRPAAVAGLEALFARYGRVPEGPDACSLAFRGGRSVLIEDAATDPLAAPARALVRELGLGAGLLTPLRNARGEPTGLIVAAFPGPHRVPERQLRLVEQYARQAGGALENARLLEEARAADRRKDEFLAMLAHELRNPLDPVLHAARLLRAPGLDEAAREEARAVIERQAGALRRLLDDLFDAARLSAGKVELHPRPVDLAEVVAMAVEAVRPLADERGHTLTTRLPRRPVRLVADPTRLTQVLVNLLRNAVRYTEPGGRVELSATAEADEVQLRVRDTGIGIAPEALARVFDLYTQGEPARAPGREGLGLGLALVRSLVELHGGCVSATSEGPGRGSEFLVCLPRGNPAEAEGAAPGPAESRPPAGPHPARRLLIVEDNADAARMLARLLRSSGHEVAVAHDGALALEMALAHRPEVVLLDIGLPDSDGYEVARRLRHELGDRPPLLVAMTGRDQEADRLLAREAGFDHHLVKPVDPDALADLLGSTEPAAP